MTVVLRVILIIITVRLFNASLTMTFDVQTAGTGATIEARRGSGRSHHAFGRCIVLGQARRPTLYAINT